MIYTGRISHAYTALNFTNSRLISVQLHGFLCCVVTAGSLLVQSQCAERVGWELHRTPRPPQKLPQFSGGSPHGAERGKHCTELPPEVRAPQDADFPTITTALFCSCA